MLRYREELGLLPEVRDRYPGARSAASPGHSAASPGRSAASGGRSAASGGRSAASGERSGASGGPHGPAHRQFSEADIAAVAAALELEKRYDISPAALAFGLRVLAEPSVRAAVADLARRLGRIPPTPSRALDFEKERALRLLQHPHR